MKWYRAETYRDVIEGTDVLNNPIANRVATGESILVRLSPALPEHLATSGNDYDKIERTYFTKAKFSLLEGITAIKVKDQLYEVVKMTIDTDSSALYVRRCKEDGDNIQRYEPSGTEASETVAS